MLRIDFGGPYPVYLYIYIEYDNTMHGNTGMLNKFFPSFFVASFWGVFGEFSEITIDVIIWYATYTY